LTPELGVLLRGQQVLSLETIRDVAREAIARLSERDRELVIEDLGLETLGIKPSGKESVFPTMGAKARRIIRARHRFMNEVVNEMNTRGRLSKPGLPE